MKTELAESNIRTTYVIPGTDGKLATVACHGTDGYYLAMVVGEYYLPGFFIDRDRKMCWPVFEQKRRTVVAWVQNGTLTTYADVLFVCRGAQAERLMKALAKGGRE